MARLQPNACQRADAENRERHHARGIPEDRQRQCRQQVADETKVIARRNECGQKNERRPAAARRRAAKMPMIASKIVSRPA